MNEAPTIRRASPEEIGEMVSIDDDACSLFAQVGLDAAIGPEHPYSLAERSCWTRCAREGNAFLMTIDGECPPVGLLVMARIDGEPYLEQLSVRRSAMGRGFGRQLLAQAIQWAGHAPLWLTTYAHVPWNRPFYERHGFVTVLEAACPLGVRAILEDQRQALPAPEHRVAMRRPPTEPR